MPVKQYAYLWFEGPTKESEWDPDDVSERLGVAPTKTHRRGEERLPGTGQTWIRTTWQYGVPETDDDDWDALIEPILSQFRDRSDRVAAVRRDLGLGCGLNLVVTMLPARIVAGEDDEEVWRVETPASSFSASHIQALAALDIGVDVAMNVWLPEDVDDDQ